MSISKGVASVSRVHGSQGGGLSCEYGECILKYPQTKLPTNMFIFLSERVGNSTTGRYALSSLSLAVSSQKYPRAPPSVGRESDTPGAAYLSIRCDTDDLQLRVNTEDSITRMTVL